MLNATLIALVLGALIPVVNAVFTKYETNPFVKSVVAVVLSALGTTAVWATDLGNVSTNWKTMATVFLGALVAAGGAAKSVLAGPVVDWVHKLTAKFGLNFVTTPEKAIAMHGGAPAVPAPGSGSPGLPPAQ